MLCTVLAMQLQRISQQQPCLSKQFFHTGLDILEKIGLVFPWHKHNVKPVFDTRHNGRYRRFHLPANSVAANGMSVLFADGKPDLRLTFVAFAVQQHKVFVGNALSVLVNVAVLIVFFKSVTRLQNETSLLSGKRVTTLVSSSCKRSASAGGFHSCAESVHFASLSFLGLIGSFHDILLLMRPKRVIVVVFAWQKSAKRPLPTIAFVLF